VGHIEQIGIKLLVTLRTIFLILLINLIFYHVKGCTSFVP